MPQLRGAGGIHTRLASDHPHYWEDGGATYHTRYTTWEFFRGQDGDPWKGVMAPGAPATIQRQDQINRSYQPTEADHSQTRTVDAGPHFLETNAAADRWLVQIELFDPHEPFSFTKSLRTMRIPTASQLINPWQHGTLLFDLDTDPRQLTPIADDEIELRMLRLLAGLMHDHDAPHSQFERLAIPYDAQPGPEHLLVRAPAERAAAIAEPLPELSDLAAAELLATPLADLLADQKHRAVVARHLPEIATTELLTLPPGLSLRYLARLAGLPAATLRAIGTDLIS